MDELYKKPVTGRPTFDFDRGRGCGAGDSVEKTSVEDPPHVHEPLIQAIVDALNGRGHAPSTGETAARTSWVMGEILREFRAGQSVR